MGDDERIRGVLEEQLLDELRAIRELVTAVPAIKASADDHGEQLRDLTEWFMVLTDVVRLQAADLKELKGSARELKSDMRGVKQSLQGQLQKITEAAGD